MLGDKAVPGGEKESASENSRNSAPAISLPKGGGAIRGMGEKFAANPVTGTGSMSVPIATSPGRSGFGPKLSLSYDSGSGNGPFGFGWNLSLPAVTRKTDKGLPLYRDAEESDVFILSGAEDLVPVLRPEGTRYTDDSTAPGFVIHRYRPRIEGLFARIERWTKVSTGEIHWRSITRDNITTLYGKDNRSRIFDPADPFSDNPTRIFSWLICESHDDKGNAVVYEYAEEDERGTDRGSANERNRVRTANRYLKRILYGNRVSRLIEPDLTKAEWLFEAIFDYDEGHYEEPNPDPPPEEHRFVLASSVAGLPWKVRPDPFSSYRSGFEVRTYRRCRRVLMFHHIPDLSAEEKGYDGLVRSNEFDYAELDCERPVGIEEELAHQGSTRFGSFLRSVTQSGYVRDDSRGEVERNGVRYAAYLKKSLPPLEFEYSKAAIQDRVLELDAASRENLPEGIDGSIRQWIDLDGEGVSGILTQQAGCWFYKPNLGDGRFGPLQKVPEIPSLAGIGGGRMQLLDLAGDGRLDLVAFTGPFPGFFERTEDRTWDPFRPFRRLPVIRWDDPDLRFVDLTGDGHADILVTEQDVFTWYPSLAEDGFEHARSVFQSLDEGRGPKLVLADGTQSIYLADMCGDGLADLVRIRNGEVIYRPNLGHGRFGPPVTMDNAPWFDHPEQFDQGRIRIADIDGSGTSDIIYLGRDGARIYFNQSGNRMSEARRLAQFPPVDNVSSVLTADLQGNGTACLVWSSPLPGNAGRPLLYMDLMGGTKPHLLIRSVNNLGAETHVRYAPSIRFYLADKRAGRPWITRLPFPVHVVERVVTLDRISGNRFVTRYAYHHGFFDGAEREFRGFGMVEQWDTEEFAACDPCGRLPEGTNEDLSSHVPPVLTKTWYHTGVCIGRGHVSDYYAGLLDAEDVGEYYREPGLTDARARALLLDDSVLPGGLTVEEEREACRALKGSMLRQEVYALDGTEKEKHPYAVTEQNFGIRMLQRRGSNRHAVIFTHARESVIFHYEREPADPRIGHALTLEVNEYGNVLKSATIGYGRRQPDPVLSPDDQARQARIFITCTESRVTNAVEAVDDHRPPLPCESRTYELSGLALQAGSNRFPFGRILDAVTTAAPLDYEKKPDAGVGQKRLIRHARTYFRRNDLDGPLPLGKLESLALPFETYRLAFTPGLLAQTFGGRVDDGMLEHEGRYVHTEGDAGWWVPSGTVFYSPDPDAMPHQELAFARQHFFFPHRYRNPFHDDSTSTESFVSYDDYDILLHETRDALGNRITVGVRPLDLPDGSVLPGKRSNDYRVLQPLLVMDPNRNCMEVRYDALGMVAGTAVMGKPEEKPRPGDVLDVSFRGDLTRDRTDRFMEKPREASVNPRESAAAQLAYDLLGKATTRVLYDIERFRRLGQAPFAAVIARETHVGDLGEGERPGIRIDFSYSDGLGREIQKKIQAEPGPVPVRGPDGKIVLDRNGRPEMTPETVSPRWVGSGWTVFNNKGNPVRQYEPFFTGTHSFEFDVRIGVSPVLFYDPVERLVATLRPNHAWEKVVFGPWRQENWDVNDTIAGEPQLDADTTGFFLLPDGTPRLAASEYLPTWHALRTDPACASEAAGRWPDPRAREAEKLAAEKAFVHAGTPAVAHADPLGRVFLTVAHNRYKYGDASRQDPPVEEFHPTRVILDIEGYQREVIDARDRVVVRYGYDMLGNRIHQASMDAGKRWMLNDVSGKPLYSWDSRGHRFRTVYDPVRRPTKSLLGEGGGPESVVGRILYGETGPNPEAANLRGKVAAFFDQAGIVYSDKYDFKGNLLRSRRRLSQAYRTTLDWSGTVALETESFAGSTRYDALNRAIQLTAPHGDRDGATGNVIRPVYNEAGLLEKVYAWLNRDAEDSVLLDTDTADLRAVRGIDYDAGGRRKRIEYGNGAVTSYEYDRETFRLVRLETTRSADNASLQDRNYTYDPAGNVTRIRDDAQQTIYFRNNRVKPGADYAYDAVYRLIEATGREHLGQGGESPIPHSSDDRSRCGLPHPGDGTAMGRYFECYVYDSVGNFLEMRHLGTDPTNPGWKRNYAYDEASLIEPDRRGNRLSGTAVGNGNSDPYRYDPHGNMVCMPHLPVMQWDYRDRLRATSRQVVGNGGAPETTWYVYDSGGERVRKVVDRPAEQGREPSRKSERIYLGGFEIHRVYAGDGTRIERETLHIMDDKRRIALVETRTEGADDGPAQLVRYQYADHLGSVVIELDDEARIISFEEYAPYGSTTCQSVLGQTETPKRYRYTGKERDEESGLYYHGARYYAPWLGRWTAVDPSGLPDGVNPFLYVRDNPVRSVDLSGKLTLDEVMNKQDNIAKLMKNQGDLNEATKFADRVKALKAQNRLPEDENFYAEHLQKLIDTEYEAANTPAGQLSSQGQENRKNTGKNSIKAQTETAALPEYERLKEEGRSYQSDASGSFVELEGQDRIKYQVDVTNLSDIHVRLKVYLDTKNVTDKALIVNQQDAIEKFLGRTKGLSVDVEFVNNPPSPGSDDVFTATVEFNDWIDSGNFWGGAKDMAHEVMHLVGLDDRYDYIKDHAGNASYTRAERLALFHMELDKLENPDPSPTAPSLMGPAKSGRKSDKLLDWEVCRIAAEEDLERLNCEIVRMNAY